MKGRKAKVIRKLMDLMMHTDGAWRKHPDLYRRLKKHGITTPEAFVEFARHDIARISRVLGQSKPGQDSMPNL